MPGELRVNTVALTRKAQSLADAANQILAELQAFTAATGDPLSAAGLAHQQAAEAALIEGLPVLKQDAVGSAEKIIRAARIYAATDNQLAGNVQQHNFDQHGPSTAAGDAGAALGRGDVW